VKALERVQKLHCNDKIFILAINRLSSACSMLIIVTFYVMGIDLNTLKTSHNSLISIAVIVKTYNSCSKSIRESLTCITCEIYVKLSQILLLQWPVTLNPTADTPLQTECSNQRLKSAIKLWKMPFISKLWLFLI